MNTYCIAQPTPWEFLAYCDNRQRELNQYALPVAYRNRVWYHIIPRATRFYQKEPRPSILIFNTYDLAEVLQKSKEPSPVDKEFPPLKEPKKEFSNHSDNSDSETEDKEATLIRNSPIVTLPPPYTFLPAITMASTSTTTITQTATQGSASVQAPAPNPSTPDQIATIFCQNFGPPEGNPGRGRGGGGGGGGGGGQPQQLQQSQQQNVSPVAGVRMMGKLPEIFNGDRTKAKDFIEEVKGYLHLN